MKKKPGKCKQRGGDLGGLVETVPVVGNRLVGVFFGVGVLLGYSKDQQCGAGSNEPTL